MPNNLTEVFKYQPKMVLSSKPQSVRITIAKDQQLLVVDSSIQRKQSKMESGGRMKIVKCTEEEEHVKKCQRICKSEVTVNGHHLCEKSTLKHYQEHSKPCASNTCLMDAFHLQIIHRYQSFIRIMYTHIQCQYISLFQALAQCSN